MNNDLFKDLTFSVIGAAMEVHNELKAGYPEHIYQLALEHELFLRGIAYERQKQIFVAYKGAPIGEYSWIWLLKTN